MHAKNWYNWSGAQHHSGVQVESPDSIEKIARLVKHCSGASRQLRCVGSGHSFNPFWTDDVILSLDNIQGLVSVDINAATAKIRAGTKIHTLGPLLWDAGLSLPQQGDIDRQSLAGALSTGTHGTGVELRSMPNSIVAITLVTANGEILEISNTQNQEIFHFARISLGVLGVVTDITLKLQPAFYLHEKNWQGDWSECESRYERMIDENRHFEFFWAPNTDIFTFKTLNPTQEPKQIIDTGEYIGPAYEVFPSERENKFNEMEYAVPFEQGWQCFCELREMLLREFPGLPWPIEYRTMAADNLPLSTAYQRKVVTLSIHQGAERSHKKLFSAAESIFERYSARPHWGKVHGLKKVELAELYPKFDAFCSVRTRLDAQGLFLNPYLFELFC